RDDGLTSELTWGSMVRTGITSRFLPTQGEDYHDASGEADDWTGNIGVVLVSGSLPPGIEPSMDAGRRIVLSGRPTAAGTFSFVLRAFDDTGATMDVPTTLQVLPPGSGGGPTWAESVINATETAEFVNCLSNRIPMPL